MAEPSAETIWRAQRGEEAALVALVRGQQRYVYSIALGVMRNSADADDMTQEVFVRLLRALGSYRGETRFTTWLYRLATNICLDGLRRRGQPVEPLDLEEAASPHARLADGDIWGQPEAWAVTAESAVEVRGALARLPTAQRLALTLLYFEDMHYDDIAAIMGAPINTVKSHVRRGKERLAVLLRRTDNAQRRVPCGALT